MRLPEYVTRDEVRRICKELKIRDWTVLKEPEVKAREARAILAAVGTGGLDVGLEDFRRGLEVELEHGTMYKDTNVTNNHPVLTGMIVMAHLKETLDYYKRLEVAEIEGDLLKAVAAMDAKKVNKYYKKLAAARVVLHKDEAGRLGR